MKRNPAQRLGSGISDAVEIKKHPFFTDINWEDVLKRKLKPPKPMNKMIKNPNYVPNVFPGNNR